MADEKQFSRRDFLKTTGVATGGIIGGSLLGGLVGFNIGDDKDDKSEQKDANHSEHGSKSEPGESLSGTIGEKTRMFFMNDNDFELVEAVMERIYPKSDAGPGAKALGAAYYLDSQLAGQYGSNAKEYMQGPFYEGLPTQGYQSPLRRAEYFTLGFGKLNDEAKDKHDKAFQELEEKDMDAILQDFQDGKIDMGVPEKIATAPFFFTMLRAVTLEGVYSDPVYRGNRNMDGWKMKDFPGSQHSYLNVIDSDEFQKIAPQPNFGL